MALRTALKDGDWSDITVWDGEETIPSIGDDIDLDGFTVTLDQNIIPTAEDIAIAVREEMDSNSTLLTDSTILADILDEVNGIVSGVVDREDMISALRAALSWPM